MITKAQLLKLIHPRIASKAVETLLDNQDIMLNGLKALSFVGKNGAGAITIAGTAIGDKVLCVVGITAAALGDASASFEGVITVAGQIQQSSASNLSTNTYIAYLI